MSMGQILNSRYLQAGHERKLFLGQEVLIESLQLPPFMDHSPRQNVGMT